MDSIKNKNSFISLAVLFDTLKYVPRLATKRFAQIDKGTVATHIFDMMYIGYLSYYSMDKEDRKSIDLLKVMKLILWHELDETITGDIPYPAKKIVNDSNPSAMKEFKNSINSYLLAQVPEKLLEEDKDVVECTLSNETCIEKSFVKLLDYVYLYLQSCKLINRNIAMTKTKHECFYHTTNHKLYDKVPFIKELMENPDEFLSMEFN